MTATPMSSAEPSMATSPSATDDATTKHYRAADPRFVAHVRTPRQEGTLGYGRNAGSRGNRKGCIVVNSGFAFLALRV